MRQISSNVPNPRGIGHRSAGVGVLIAMAMLPAAAFAGAGPGCSAFHAGPGFTLAPSWNGYVIPSLNGSRSVQDAAGVLYADRYDLGTSRGTRAIRVTPSGWVELAPLGERFGSTSCYVQNLNTAGEATGWASAYDATGRSIGTRAVRWSAAGVPTKLQDLGTDSFGLTSVTARDINSFGAIAGGANRYGPTGQSIGSRAVRWNAGSTLATLLQPLNTNATGTTYSGAAAINDAGTVVGYAQRWGSSTPGGGDDGGVPGTTGDRGQRPLRWPAGSTIPTELGHLGTNAAGYTNANPTDINASGLAVGWALKYTVGGAASLGRRGVAWLPESTAAVELQAPTTTTEGFSECDVWDLSDAGLAVGAVDVHSTVGVLIGERAARWVASTGEVVLLDRHPSDVSGFGSSAAWSINESGACAGRAESFNAAGVPLGWRAMVWTASGRAVDLTDFMPTGEGWVALTSAAGISEQGWVTGVGMFDADGPGPQGASSRMFLLKLPVSLLSECQVDFDCSGAATLQDIFDFLNAWFAASPDADFDGINGVDVQDIFAFLNAWFAGC